MSDDTTSDRPTNLVDLMAELIPPPEPEPISLMPQTLGWPVLVIVLAGLVAFAARRLLNARQAEAYRGAALAALDEAGSTPAKVVLVLRQTALAAFPRVDVAGLYGQDWLDFLAATGGQSEFHGPNGTALITLPYSEGATLPDAAVQLVRDWICHHKRADVS